MNQQLNTKGTIQNLLDELVAGNPHSDVIQTHMDVILTWLARPDSEKVEEFRNTYLQRNISEEILRGYVLFILEQKLFSNENLAPHQILALPSGPTKEQIKSRYQKLIRIYHPDRGLGDPRILHQHAEKINQAYQHLSANTASINSNPRPTYTVKTPTVDTTADSFVETVLTRKLRRKLGNAKQFQMIFFGAVATVCLLLILLIYIQPETVNTGRSYSKTSVQTEIIDQVSDVTNKVEEEKVDSLSANNTLPFEADIENVELGNNDLKPNEDLIENATESEHSMENGEILDKDVPVSNLLIDRKSKNYNIPSTDEITSSDDADKVGEKTEIEIADLLTQDIDIIDPQAEQKPATIKQITQVEAKQASSKQIELIPDDTEQDSLAAQASNSKTKVVQQPKQQKVSGKKKSNSDSTSKEQSGKSKKASQSIVEIEIVEPKAAIQKNTSDSKQTSEQVQIEEVQVSKIIKPSIKHSKANLFERRFARKFVIRYLESIEQGNISLINDFLSERLSINGVSNNKYNYLKNTTQMISDSNKRSYRINFVGDVLRLDKGSFRVTLKEHQTVIFKNNRRTQTSSTKSYDIKRYSYGSEIVSISDV